MQSSASEAGDWLVDICTILEAIVREPALYKVPSRRAPADYSRHRSALCRQPRLVSVLVPPSSSVLVPHHSRLILRPGGEIFDQDQGLAADIFLSF